MERKKFSDLTEAEKDRAVEQALDGMATDSGWRGPDQAWRDDLSEAPLENDVERDRHGRKQD